jgi:hypothetical protein
MSLNGKKPLTELDKRLQEMALLNWNQFVALVGEKCIMSAKICILRQKNKSLGEISQKLGITYRQSEWGCGKCDVPEGGQANQQDQTQA